MDESDLRKFDWDHPPRDIVPREKHVQEAYDNVPLEKRQKFIKRVSKGVNNGNLLFIPNNFPYYTVSRIKHSCLWSKYPLEKKDVEDYLKANSIKYITFFCNDPEYRSIPKFPHYHIFHY